MKSIVPLRRALCAALAALACAHAPAADLSAKDASAATIAANRAVAAQRTLADPQQTAEASRGLIATLEGAPIVDAGGAMVWDTQRFDFIRGSAPDSVNPSLWESAKLTATHGLFKVGDGIYQIRGYDIDNMTLVAGKTGWIVIDPMATAETARAALALADKHLGKKPIVAMIYTHSHVDHFGGARGIVDQAAVDAGRVRVIAPAGFMDNAVAENVLAGNAMIRRAHYQFGMPLVAGPKGVVGVGLGAGTPEGSTTLIAPTESITRTGQQLTVDGVRIVFQMTPVTEAPSEMLFYFPDLKALCVAEDVNKTMHNIYTLRGAKARDALGWSKYVNELLDLFPDAEVAFGSHTWPTWGKERIRRMIVNQRDMYRFIHDEALRLANEGKKMDDLGNAAFYPKGLQDDLATRGYYGSLSHNLRAVYNYYLGYYDGNPATLYRYAPAETSRRYVAALGGATAVLAQGRKAYADGDYRWTAELVNHVVMADPHNDEARALQADALEQIAYQSENGVWRNAYLTGARELRSGPRQVHVSTLGQDVLRTMTPEMIFDLLAVRLRHEQVDGLSLGINLSMPTAASSLRWS